MQVTIHTMMHNTHLVPCLYRPRQVLNVQGVAYKARQLADHKADCGHLSPMICSLWLYKQRAPIFGGIRGRLLLQIGPQKSHQVLRGPRLCSPAAQTPHLWVSHKAHPKGQNKKRWVICESFGIEPTQIPRERMRGW